MELIASRHHLMKKFMRLGVFKLCEGNKKSDIYSRKHFLLQAKEQRYHLKAKTQKTYTSGL